MSFRTDEHSDNNMLSNTLSELSFLSCVERTSADGPQLTVSIDTQADLRLPIGGGFRIVSLRETIPARGNNEKNRNPPETEKT